MYYFDAPKNLIIKNWLCHLFCKKISKNHGFLPFSTMKVMGKSILESLKAEKCSTYFC